MKDEDYVDEMLKVGDCGDCCSEGALIEPACDVENDDTIISDECPFMRDPEIIYQIKEMAIIPTTEGACE
jgi:hypothetical protein